VSMTFVSRAGSETLRQAVCSAAIGETGQSST
jgi:hypothetical protein